MEMEHSAPIRVLLVDDHRRIHEAVAGILATVTDIELVAQASNGAEGIFLSEESGPDLILMDVVMPTMDGVTATRIIHERFPKIKILVLSSFQDHESVYSMLQGGASGYILKGSLAHDLVHSIRAAHRGKAVFSDEVAGHLLNPPPQTESRQYNLTDRELNVLGLMAEGLNNNQIAHDLTISQSTVKFHIANILGKLGVDTRAEALVAAAHNNLI
jgi:two-component system, NarL family, response regulator LiaR